MSILKRKSNIERRRGVDRRSGSKRRKHPTKRRMRAGFRSAVLQSYRRPGRDHQPLSKKEWLDTLILSTALEASRYTCRDANGLKIPWRFALEKAGELAWDLHQLRFAKESRIYSTIERVARMTELTVDYLLAEYRITHVGRRVNPDRRA